MNDAVIKFLNDTIDDTTKVFDKEKANDTLLFLPYPFTTPCAEGMFQEMYYWDTYFTCKALYLLGKESQVLNNIRNFDYMLKEYGRIPNGNRSYYLNRSQPPFFALMLKDYLEYGKGEIEVDEAYRILKREYDFWQSKRQSESGLNRYFCDVTEADVEAEFGPIGTPYTWERTGESFLVSKEKYVHIYAEAESGWDFNPRFDDRCTDFNPIDLNSLLYAMECLLSEWAPLNEKDTYKAAAEKRRALINKYCLGDDGIYYDYDFKNGKRSDAVSCASFYPYFVGISNDREAFKLLLGKLEAPYGLLSALTDKKCYQWAEPNSWAPLTYIAAFSADKIGLKEDAKRLAKKYVDAIESIFEKSGHLWEKYNANTGGLEVFDEYEQPKMLGWTAGTYAAMREYLLNDRIV